MKKWIFLGMQLVFFEGMGAEGDASQDPWSYLFREQLQEPVRGVVKCESGRLMLVMYKGGRPVKQYEVLLREGFFVGILALCDVTEGLSHKVIDKGNPKVLPKMKMDMYGKKLIINWSEKMVILRCEVSIEDKKEVFEVGLENFCDLDEWRRQVEEARRGHHVRGVGRLRVRDLLRIRSELIDFNCGLERTKPLTQEEVDQYFLGIKVTDAE